MMKIAPHSFLRPRDLRLDFFRGLGMFIIFIAHLPGNTWTLYIPARFGFSDAAEIFVFCSGMASAIAFGRVFDLHGWLMVSARVMHRVWQVYWAHVIQFLVIAAMLYWFDTLREKPVFIDLLNLSWFFKEPGRNLGGLLTLRYVPNYFDILPMYLVILALLPVMLAVRKMSTGAAICLSVGLWLAANFRLLDLPAEPWSGRVWFFNPFAWQLVFFSGFALMAGWVKPPPINRRLIWLSVAIIITSVPFAYYRILNEFDSLLAVRDFLEPVIDKTQFGVLRYVHFLALAYLAWIAVGEHGARLSLSGFWGSVVAVIRKVGQQSLAVFLVSLVAAQIIGAWLYIYEPTAINMTAANLTGFSVLIVTAYVTAWFKGAPWRRPPKNLTEDQRRAERAWMPAPTPGE